MIEQAPGQGPIGTEDALMPQLTTSLRRHLRLIAGLSGASFVSVVLLLSFREPRYTSTASFVPQSNRPTSALAGVAATLGVEASMTGNAPSPAFYADLVKSRDLLTSILRVEYSFPTRSGVASGKLVDLLRIKGSSEQLRMEKAVRKLSGVLEVNYKVRTGMISIAAQMPNPVLAQRVVQRFLDELARFNLEQRKSQAGAERRFTEERLVALQRELRAAEDRMQAFMQRNRDYRNAPELMFEYERMARDVAFRQTVYSGVAQANERARMDEVRDTPVITVVDQPSLPAEADGRGRLRFGLLAGILGGFAALGIGVARDTAAQPM